MTLEKAHDSRHTLRVKMLVGVACSVLFVAASSHAQAAPNQEETTAQLHTLHLNATPQVATAAIRPFQVNFPEEQLVDLRRRIAATKWAGGPNSVRPSHLFDQACHSEQKAKLL